MLVVERGEAPEAGAVGVVERARAQRQQRAEQRHVHRGEEQGEDARSPGGTRRAAAAAEGREPDQEADREERESARAPCTACEPRAAACSTGACQPQTTTNSSAIASIGANSSGRKRRRIEARAGEPDREQGCGDRDHRDVDDHVAGKARPDAEHRRAQPDHRQDQTACGRQQRPHYRQLAKKTAGSATNTVATKLSPLSIKVA